MFDVWMMLMFGIVGYLFQKLDYPLPPLVLAIVLGDKAEESFRQALLGSQGSMAAFFWDAQYGIKWLSSAIMILGVTLLLWPLVTWVRERLAGGPAPAAGAAPSGAQAAGDAPPTPADRMAALRAENAAIKRQLAEAIIDHDERAPTTPEALERENRELGARLEQYVDARQNGPKDRPR
jgi:hypothetical protein